MSYQITTKTNFTSLKALEQRFLTEDPSYENYSITATIIKKSQIQNNQKSNSNCSLQNLIIYDGIDTMRLVLHNDFISAYSEHLRIGFDYRFSNGFLKAADAQSNCCSITSCTMNSGFRNRTQLKFKELGQNFGSFSAQQMSQIENTKNNLAITNGNSDENSRKLEEKISKNLNYDFTPLSDLNIKSKTDILDITATILKIGDLEEYEVQKFARRLTLIDSTSTQITCLLYNNQAENFIKTYKAKEGNCIILKNVRTYEHPFIQERVINCSEIDTIIDVKHGFENKTEFEFSWWNHVGQFQNRLDRHARDIRKSSDHLGFEKVEDLSRDEILKNSAKNLDCNLVVIIN